MKVSIIIPCRNEEKYIACCLDSIIKNQTFQGEKEIFVVDGMSTDKTKNIVKEYEEKYGFVHLVDNPKLIAAAALNLGIKRSSGEIIIRLDAHTSYSENYIAKCLETLQKYAAANAGGSIKTLPSDNTLLAKAIAFSISHIFGVGRSFFRIGSKKARYVDTVPFGCFRRDIFDKIGYFNEDQPRNEDKDFNSRILKAGEKIILSPEIVSFYYSRGTLKSFWKHNFDNGKKTTSQISFDNLFLSLRHFIPLFCLLSFAVLAVLSFFYQPFIFIILGLIIIYIIFSLSFSFQIAIRERDIRYFFVMPFIFFLLHFGYALGALWGIIVYKKHRSLNF